MLEELGQITARIGEIQAKLAALGGQSTAPPPAAGTKDTFAQTLEQAQQGTPSAAPSAPAPKGVTVPPASLGPLPPMPVSPDAANIVPMAKAGDYADLIQTYAGKHGLSPDLVRAVIHTESGGNPRATSHAGALGLMQLMPENVKEAGISDPFDPEQNIAAGTTQLAGLMEKYHGDLDLALAAYNAGSGAVRKYGGVPPFSETRSYIRKVRAAMGQG